MKRRAAAWVLALGGAAVMLGLMIAAPDPSLEIASQLKRVEVASDKPSAPVSIRLVPLAMAGPDQQWARVEVVPRADAPRLEVEVTASDGLAIQGGAHHLGRPGAQGRSDGAGAAALACAGAPWRGAGRAAAGSDGEPGV